MILLLKNLFQKKKVDDFEIKKIIHIENETIKFNDYKVFSDEERLIEELSFSEVEWIEIDADFIDYSTIEPCLYIKVENSLNSIHFSIIEDPEKEFVKELFKAFQIDEEHLAFLNKKQKRKVVYTRNKSIKHPKVDNSKAGIFQKKQKS